MSLLHLTIIFFRNNIVITMNKQTVFRAGNSNVVAIPKYLSEELGIKSGQKVTIDKTSDGSAIVIKISGKTKRAPKATRKEFKRWLSKVLKEDSEILDELAVR